MPDSALQASSPRAPGARRVPRARRWLVWGGVSLVLALVSASYLSPHLMIDLADRLWACF